MLCTKMSILFLPFNLSPTVKVHPSWILTLRTHQECWDGPEHNYLLLVLLLLVVSVCSETMSYHPKSKLGWAPISRLTPFGNLIIVCKDDKPCHDYWAHPCISIGIWTINYTTCILALGTHWDCWDGPGCKYLPFVFSMLLIYALNQYHIIP